MSWEMQDVCLVCGSDRAGWPRLAVLFLRVGKRFAPWGTCRLFTGIEGTHHQNTPQIYLLCISIYHIF